MSTAPISLHNLTLGYRDRTLLQDVSVSFRSGELCALLGRNGTGKSTLLRAISGLGQIKHGDIRICGRSVGEMNSWQIARLVSFVSTERVRVTNLRAVDVVALGRSPHTGWSGRLNGEDRHIVGLAIDAVGMSALADKPTDSLSDGENQRVMIARALAQATPIILLDEPTAFLDAAGRYDMTLLLRDLAHREGKTIIFSTHDLSVATRLCDTAALMAERTIHYGPAQELLHSGTLQKLFDGTGLSINPESGDVDLSI